MMNEKIEQPLTPIPAPRPDAPAVVAEQWRRHKFPELSRETCTTYSNGLRYFLGYLESVGVTRMELLRAEHVLGFQQSLALGHGLSPASQQVFLKVGRYLCEFAVSTGRTSDNPFTETRPTLTGLPRHLVDTAAIERMIASCGDQTAVDVRDRSIIALLHEAALPPRALAKLNLHNEKMPPVNCVFPDGRVTWLAAGGRVVTVGIGQRTLAIIEAWLSRRHAFARHASESALFLTRRGHRLTHSGINGLLKRRAHAAGLVDSINAGQLRKRRAVEILTQAGVQAASFQLGHGTEKVTREVLGEEIAALGIGDA